MNYFTNFLFSFISTIGFSILFNVPMTSIMYAGLTGGVGWTLYVYTSSISSPVFASFIGSIVIGILGEIFARVQKKPVTIFVIPGIVPLVPGYAMYLSMINLINKDFYKAIEFGTEAILKGGAISGGIIVISSIAKILKDRKRRKLRIDKNQI